MRVAVVAAGQMGAGVGGRLAQHGAEVWTVLEGRSADSRGRARAAGMRDVPLTQLSQCDFVLSIVPPASAAQFAESAAASLAAAERKPVFVDCNAVCPDTAEAIGEMLCAQGVPFVDAGIIGLPPSADAAGPNFYASGPEARGFAALARFGLSVRVLEAPVGAASALKMSYAGITKGLTAAAVTMILAAERAQVLEALHRELAESQAPLLAGLARSIPAMFPKAYRWVAEMQEIAEYAHTEAGAARLFAGASELYERIAADVAGPRHESARLDRFLKHGSGAGG